MNFPALDAKGILLLALAGFTIFFIVVLVIGIRRAKEEKRDDVTPTAGTIGTGFVANFFDTLGIGSFATTTAIFRQWRMVRDEIIPGTLNAGHTLPTVAQAVIYTQIVPVDSKTLILMIVAAVAGAWLGAGFFSGWPRRNIQIGMGFALFVAAILMLYKAIKGDPTGGDALALSGGLLVAGLVGNFVLGILMTIGIGLYGPCMLLVSLLGMNPTSAFPIMMGSCAFLMPVASARFIKEKAWHPGATLAMAIGGIPAVLIAAYIVKSLPLNAVRYLVVVVVIYTSISLLRAAKYERSKTAELQSGAKEVAGS